MEKQEGEERHANSTKSLIEFWDIRPASVPSSLLDTGDSSSTLVESQESEEETDGKNNAFHERMAYFYMITCTVGLHADGTQVQAHSPVDSAVISGIENEITDDEEPRDEAGRYI